MLLTSVILVLREVLEAAVLVSVLLALSRSLGQQLRWIWWSLPLALLGSVWLASSMDTLTDAWDGAGQEVVNAGLQLLVFVCIVAVVFVEGLRPSGRMLLLRVLMVSAVTLALVREGSEIWIYVSGFAASEDMRTPVLLGSIIGAAIGISLGILLYSALRAAPEAWRRYAFLLLLALIGAGMVMQASMLLEQVDWLEAGRPLWDSSSLIDEASIGGELLYAVFGYEATPSPIQGILYLASLLTVAMAVTFSRLWGKSSNAVQVKDK